jgi:hypothetical protein
MLEVPKREIIINFLQFLLNFIILIHFNYPRIIQNKNPNYFFLKFIINFIILKFELLEICKTELIITFSEIY